MFAHKFVKTPEIAQVNGRYMRHYVNEELGIRLPSITTVLSKTKDTKFLDEWKARVGEEEAKRITARAAARGTAMHALCEDLVLNQEFRDQDNEIAKVLFAVCEPYLKKHVDNIHGSEIALFSTHLGIAGTCDLVAEHDGTLAIVDFKSSDKMKREDWIEDYFLQCAFYAKAFHELTGMLPQKTVVMIAVEPHTDWRGIDQPATIQEFIRTPKMIIEDLKKLQARKALFDKIVPPAPKKVF